MKFPRPFKRLSPALLASACVALLCLAGIGARPARAQQTNPVDRKVQNPVTDTPNVNPLTQEQPVVRPRRQVAPPQPGGKTDAGAQSQSMEELDVRSDRETISGPEEARVVVNEGNVE